MTGTAAAGVEPVEPSQELVEVVDPDGRVVDVVPRGEMRRRGLRHRATYVVVRSSTGAVLAHRRAPWKDIWPHRWDLAFGGVCAVGEGWDDSARRELAEEAGVVATLRPLGPVSYDGPETAVVGRLYEAIHDGPFTFADGEVVATEWVPVAALGAWARTHELCDDTASVVLPVLVAPGSVGAAADHTRST